MVAGLDDEQPTGPAVGQAELDAAMRAITQAAWQVITGVDQASITVVALGGGLETVAPTNDLIVKADCLQYRLGEGPCVVAVTTGTDVVADHVSTDDRWPSYGPRAGELGISAQVSLPLQGDGRTWGTLNLYSLTDGAFDDVSLETAELLATSAAAVLGLTRQVTTLSAALASRTTIGAAIGIVMKHYGIEQNRAFDYLVRRSQSANLKLRVVARRIVDEVERTGGFHG